MNDLTKDLLLAILPTKEAWDRKGNLRRSYVLGEVNRARDFLFYRTVMFPLYHRAARLLYVLWGNGKCKDEHFSTEELDETIGPALIVIECDRPTCHVQFDFSEMMQRFFEFYHWNRHPQWRFEEPTEEEILSLGVRYEPPPEPQLRMF
jgi:hypothetical protein